MPAISRLAPMVIARVLPGTAARWLAQRMTTPRRSFVLADADPVMAAGRSFRVPHAGGWLKGWQWGTGPTVLLLHGWNGYAAQLKDFIDPMVGAGHRVVAFDAPAHGDSDGTDTDLVDYGAAILAVAGTVGPVHGIIAHSFGASAAAFAVRTGLDVDRLVLLAPPRDIAFYARAMRHALGLPERIDRPVQARLERRLGLSWEDLRLDRLLDGVAARVLIVHDGGRPVATCGLGHRRILDDPKVIGRAIDFTVGTVP